MEQVTTRKFVVEYVRYNAPDVVMGKEFVLFEDAKVYFYILITQGDPRGIQYANVIERVFEDTFVNCETCGHSHRGDMTHTDTVKITLDTRPKEDEENMTFERVR